METIYSSAIRDASRRVGADDDIRNIGVRAAHVQMVGAGCDDEDRPRGGGGVLAFDLHIISVIYSIHRRSLSMLRHLHINTHTLHGHSSVTLSRSLSLPWRVHTLMIVRTSVALSHSTRCRSSTSTYTRIRHMHPLQGDGCSRSLLHSHASLTLLHTS